MSKENELKHKILFAWQMGKDEGYQEAKAEMEKQFSDAIDENIICICKCGFSMKLEDTKLGKEYCRKCGDWCVNYINVDKLKQKLGLRAEGLKPKATPEVEK
jgi:hypothetical protein